MFRIRSKKLKHLSRTGDIGFIYTGTQRKGFFAPNVELRYDAGGVTLSTTMLSFTDAQPTRRVTPMIPVGPTFFANL